MSNLVEHAKRELEIIGEDKETTEGLLAVIQAFSDMGHSGGSAMVCIPRIAKLLSFENLAPITDNPEDWFHHGPETWGGEDGEGIWQCKRNSKLFSEDGGKTYSDVEDEVSTRTLFVSIPDHA